MRFEFHYKFENLNDIICNSRANVYKANNIKKKEMSYVASKIKNLKPIEEYPVKITAIWHVKDKRRDLDNMVLKNVLDAFVKEGILKNDSLKYINEIDYKAVVDNDIFLELIIG